MYKTNIICQSYYKNHLSVSQGVYNVWETNNINYINAVNDFYTMLFQNLTQRHSLAHSEVTKYKIDNTVE